MPAAAPTGDVVTSGGSASTTGAIGTGACGGVYTVRFRHYDTSLGRWLERDPLGYVDGMSLYEYVSGMPLIAFDPFGLHYFIWDPPILSGEYWEYFDEGWEVVGSGVHVVLDAVGLIPLAGELMDGLNAVIYLVEGNRGNAALSAAAMLPLAGPAATLTKRGKQLAQKFGRFKRWLGFGGAAPTMFKWGRAGWNQMQDLMNRLAAMSIDWWTGRVTKLGPGCFITGTLVATATGAVPIEDIRPGDQVWSYEQGANEWRLAEVFATQERQFEGDLVTLRLQTGDGQYEEIACTGGHPFWVIEGVTLGQRPACAELPADDSRLTPSGRWTEARWLRLGDKFLTRTGVSATVVGLTIRMERVTVYNLQVKGLQLYAVSKCGVLVHNSDPSYLNYWTRKAPVNSSPYNVYRQYNPDGTLKQVTTYDKAGNRAHQYEVGPGTRHGEGQHDFCPETGERSKHIPWSSK